MLELSQHWKNIVIRIFDNMDAGAPIIYSSYFIPTIRWLHEEWVRLKAETISNCWSNCIESSGNNIHCSNGIKCQK